MNMNDYQKFIHISRYARWIPALNRRETWEETVDRYINFFDQRTNKHFHSTLDECKQAILSLDVMPSMRALMTAGEALDRENIAGYNCSYLAINRKRAFSETLYILMCGTGVGFSCERQEISKLPTIPTLSSVNHIICIEDSKMGWALAFEELLESLWNGEIPSFDYSKIRPAGTRLKTFGGRASGPAPLKKLFDYTIALFKKATGRKLQSIECHDLMCVIGEIVVVGGVRRSALISLSNLSDMRMRDAKTGQWWIDHPERALANNSICYTEKPSSEVFLEEWLSLMKSKSGERGIFNRQAAQKQAGKMGRTITENYGCNPCSEIILRDRQFCNLTEVIIRPSDDLESLKNKVRIASILGTFQATLTDFGYISHQWKKNTEEESLLGVSLTGILDNNMMSSFHNEQVLEKLRVVACYHNYNFACKLKIKPAAAITCVKPSGTVSQLCDTASGLHTRHSKYYIRTVRIDKKDPLYLFMKDSGFVIEDEVMRPDSTAVISFPIVSPEGSLTRKDLTAIQHLELWLNYQRHWCEHKPSVTISVQDDEWLEVGAWVYKHFDEVSGVSFLPYSDHTYQQAPYQEMTEIEFNQWCKDHPQPSSIDFKNLSNYEKDDFTTASQELSCSSGSCDLI